jgi:hypothetical protein
MHMSERLTMHDFQFLLEYTHPYSISLYLPTQEMGDIKRKREIVYKDLVQQVELQLHQLGMTEDECRKQINKLNALGETEQLWQQSNQGLAVFMSPTLQQTYQVPVEMPPTATVFHRFQLKPLLPLIAQPCEFYLLSLSKKTVELFKGDCYELKKELVPDLPESMEEVVGTETGERHLQFHTSTTTPSGSVRPAMYHGSSSWKDDKHKYLARYLQRVDTAVERHLRNSKAPLIIAGVERMRTIYTKVNTYSDFLRDFVMKGNKEKNSLVDLHQHALDLLRPHFYEEERATITRHFDHGSGSKISTDVSEILREAQQGRVDTVLVAKNVRQWGTFDPDTLKVQYLPEAQPTSHDLLDLACATTLLNGGKAYVLPPDQIPDHQNIAAVFRY